MKKQIFLVGALVAIAMSSMFVACADKNTPSDGCTCTVVWTDGTKERQSMTLSEMQEEYDVRTCGQLEAEVAHELDASGQWYKSIDCKSR